MAGRCAKIPRPASLLMLSTFSALNNSPSSCDASRLAMSRTMALNVSSSSHSVGMMRVLASSVVLSPPPKDFPPPPCPLMLES